MRSNMIINGNKLAEYLDKINFSKREFVDCLRESEPFTICNEEDGLQVAYNLDESLPMDLFARRVALNYEQSRKLIKLLGADVAQIIIDWEAMGMQNPLYKQLFEKILKGLGDKFEPRNKYAYQG